MTARPASFVDVLAEDRFCSGCDENLLDAAIVREARYGMTIVTCPRCGRVEQIEGRPLRRTEQRWTGLVLGFAIIGLLALWAPSNFAVMGISVAVAEEATSRLWSEVIRVYEQEFPADAGGRFDEDVQVVTTPGAGPAAAPAVQVVVTEADPGLRDRFGAWFAGQDRAALFDRIGGWGAVMEWNVLWPWLVAGFVPLGFGILWSMVLLNVSRRRMVLAWPCVCVWSILAVAAMAIAATMIPVRTPHDAAMAIAVPRVLPMIGLYYAMLLLAGMVIGRSVLRGMVRLTLSPRAISAMARLWLVDGLPPPRPLWGRTLAAPGACSANS